MAGSLPNILQCPEREAIRIALYELLNSSDDDLIQESAAASSAITKQKGHTSRDRSFSVSLPPQEKADALELADHLGLTDKELLRLAVIYLAKGIRTGQIKRLAKSPKIGQDKLAREWSRQHQGKPPSEQTKALKQAAKDAYDEAALLGEEADAAAYERRGQIFNELNYDGSLNSYSNLFKDENGKLDLDDYILQAFAAMQAGSLNVDDLEDEIEQLAEDRRKAAYLEQVAVSYLRVGIAVTDEELEDWWDDYLKRKAEEQYMASLSEEEYNLLIYDDPKGWQPTEPRTDLPATELDERFSKPAERRADDWHDQKPDEVTRDWWLRISGPQIVDRLELTEEFGNPLRNRWYLRLTQTQTEAAKAIESETGKSYEHITLSEIRRRLEDQG